MKRILIIEDDETIAAIERDYLTVNDFETDIAASGPDGIRMGRMGRYDLILLDLMLPGMDGFDVCRRLRETLDIPILMVTARQEDIDKIKGLGMGADDYITKPFSVKELAARVRAVIRRQEYLSVAGEPVLSGHGITLDYARRAVTKNGLPVELTHREFELLYTLMKTPGRVFTREMLLDTVWKVDFYGDTRTVDVHVRYLRQKLEDEPDNPKRILTVRGVGYRFAE